VAGCMWDDADADARGFLWTPEEGLLDLGLLEGGTTFEAWCVNGSDQVVGEADASDGQRRAVIWDRTHGLQDLNDRMERFSSRGWVLTQARGINDRGWVVGQGVKDGRIRAFLLRPVNCDVNGDHRIDAVDL